MARLVEWGDRAARVRVEITPGDSQRDDEGLNDKITELLARIEAENEEKKAAEAKGLAPPT